MILFLTMNALNCEPANLIRASKSVVDQEVQKKKKGLRGELQFECVLLAGTKF